MALLLFGTLRDAALREVVAGQPLAGRTVDVTGQAAFRPVAGDSAVVAPGAGAEALLVDPPAGVLARMDHYAGAQGLVRGTASVNVDGTEVEADFYRGAAAHTSEAWDLAAWQQAWGPVVRRAAVEVMALMGQVPAARLAELMPTLLVRAASALRGARAPAPVRLRAGFDRDTVQVRAERQPYTGFFALREMDLVHPTFSGGHSATLERAAFLMCDAVTVLPYDPVRDRVMLVEQFRFATFARGDRYPWSLEPIAGRIDAGETPEQSARREAREEAGLTIRKLVPIANYYPSPGAATEYLYTFVGIADLPDSAAGNGGLEGEGEDIRSHVLPFDDLQELIALGEIDNAPLLVSALWLAPRRATLG